MRGLYSLSTESVFRMQKFAWAGFHFLFSRCSMHACGEEVDVLFFFLFFFIPSGFKFRRQLYKFFFFLVRQNPTFFFFAYLFLQTSGVLFYASTNFFPPAILYFSCWNFLHPLKSVRHISKIGAIVFFSIIFIKLIYHPR